MSDKKLDIDPNRPLMQFYQAAEYARQQGGRLPTMVEIDRGLQSGTLAKPLQPGIFYWASDDPNYRQHSDYFGHVVVVADKPTPEGM